MRHDVIAALTQYEKYNMISSAAQLLINVENLEGTISLTNSLKKLLVQIFDQEEEHYIVESVSSPLRVYRDCANYCTAYKEAGGCKYYSDGRFTVNHYTIYTMPSWEPKNPKIISIIQDKNRKFKLSFEQRDNSSSVSSISQEEIETQDKDFWKQLNVHKRLFMKYQMCKYVDKKFRPVKRLFANGKTMFDVVDIIKQTIHIPNSTEYLNSTIDKLYYSLFGLFQRYSNYLELYRFKSVDSIATAYRNRSLLKPFSYGNSLSNNSYWEIQRFIIVDDPDIANINPTKTSDIKTQFSDYKAKVIVNVIHTLQSLVDDDIIDPTLKDFLIIQGLVREKLKEEK